MITRQQTNQVDLRYGLFNVSKLKAKIISVTEWIHETYRFRVCWLCYIYSVVAFLIPVTKYLIETTYGRTCVSSSSSGDRTYHTGESMAEFMTVCSCYVTHLSRARNTTWTQMRAGFKLQGPPLETYFYHLGSTLRGFITSQIELYLEPKCLNT